MMSKTGDFTMRQMWDAAEAHDTDLAHMLADCLNRIEAAQEALLVVYGNQAFANTLAHDVAADVKWILDGEPDGADA